MIGPQQVGGHVNHVREIVQRLEQAVLAHWGQPNAAATCEVYINLPNCSYMAELSGNEQARVQLVLLDCAASGWVAKHSRVRVNNDEEAQHEGKRYCSLFQLRKPDA